MTVSRAWWRDRGSRDWPNIFGQFVDPADQDLAKIPYVRSTLQMDAPIPMDDLPAAPDRPRADLPEIAHRALVILVRELDALLSPVVTHLDRGISGT